MLVRRERPDDEPSIHALHAAAFGRAAEADLVTALRDAGDVVLSLVAERDGAVVGSVVCSRASLGGSPTLGLGPLGVLPAHQLTGVGSALVHAALGAADALGHPEVVLLGNPAYYSRFGFELAGPLGVVPVDPAWAPGFQVRKLAAWTPARHGAFHYAPAFDAV